MFYLPELTFHKTDPELSYTTNFPSSSKINISAVFLAGIFHITLIPFIIKISPECLNCSPSSVTPDCQVPGLIQTASTLFLYNTRFESPCITRVNFPLLDFSFECLHKFSPLVRLLLGSITQSREGECYFHLEKC